MSLKPCTTEASSACISMTYDIEGAVTDLDKATSLKPQHAGAHECFADALMQAGKETEAEIHYRLAEEIKKKARH